MRLNYFGHKLNKSMIIPNIDKIIYGFLKVTKYRYIPKGRRLL